MKIVTWKALARGALTLLPIVGFAYAGSAEARQFKYAGIINLRGLEPQHVSPENFGFMQNMIEPLVQINVNGDVIPQLAERWEQTEPERWRFYLRKGVKFHDGDTFDADDVMFTYQRAQHRNAFMSAPLARVANFIKVDDYTIDITTKGINPTLPRNLISVNIMSKEWSIANNSTEPAARDGSSENYATRHINGTGPFILKEFDPGTSLEMVPNPNWWGGKRTDSLDSAKYFPIANASTMIAALIAGEIDLAVGVSPDLVERLEQTKGLSIQKTRNTLSQFLAMNQWPDQLEESSVKGKNPFKDIRVRQAIYYAIDVPAIVDKLFRGYAYVTDLTVAPQIFGSTPELDKHEPADLPRAKRLMTEAGYPDGFEVGFDCPTNFWVKGDQMCLAISAMLAQIGIKTRINQMTSTQWATKVQRPNFGGSMFLHSSATAGFDSGSHLELLYPRRKCEKCAENNNASGGGTAEIDALIDKQRTEPDTAKRLALIGETWKQIKAEKMYIPLIQPAVIWAMRDSVEAKVDPVNRLFLTDVKLK